MTGTQDPFERRWAPPTVDQPETQGTAPEPDDGTAAPELLGPGWAILAGLLAAVAGALAWGYITKWTGHQFGFLAWGVGAVVWLAVGRTAGRGVVPQAIAMICALIGVVLGKYFTFAFTFEEQFGGTAGVLSGDMIRYFRDDWRDVFDLFDVLWLALAVGTPWALLYAVDDETAEPAPAAGAGTRLPRTDRYGTLTEQETGAAWAPSHHAPEAVHPTRNPVDRLARRLPQPWRSIVDWVVTIAGAVGIVLLIKAFVVNPYRIPSSSMEPTLHCARPAQGCEARFSDRVLANRFIYHFTSPKRGDIVVFDTPPAAQVKCGAGGTFVKRIIGLPGDHLQVKVLRGNGYVFIDGRQLKEPYIQLQRRAPATPYPAGGGVFTVPRGQYFMMGDNRSQSCDSRFWGTVPRDSISGKVFMTYWPPHRLSFH